MTSSRPSASGTPDILTSAQLHALFDILTHCETYAEVERFKDPATISEYGYPFMRRRPDGKSSYAPDSAVPLLAGLLRGIVLTIPGVRDLPSEFWHDRFQGILTKLSEAELSESYDRGTLGTRKTLATAASAIHETVSRGILGGIPKGVKRNLEGPYDRSRAEDLVRAWEDVVHELVYGDLIDELFECTTKLKSLEEHSPAVRASVDYIIIHLATLIHHVFVLSPEGIYLLKLVESIHKLIPYTMIRQTLRIGNAATMINGMVRLLLAKIGVGAISNWFGLTQNADDGMNLLQRIISLVLSWDSSEFRKSIDKVEKATGGPSKELAAIKQYVDNYDRTRHEATRQDSIVSSISMIAAILKGSDASLLASLSESQHAQCAEYFSSLLAIRDREELARVLCRQNPDLFTKAIKDFVGSFDDMIRIVHEKVDLREHAVSAAETFITDFISTNKPKTTPNGSSTNNDANNQAPSIEDYARLLRRNRHLLYNWLHQIANLCPSISSDFLAWAKDSIKLFRLHQPPPPPIPDPDTTRHTAAGALTQPLQTLFASLPPSLHPSILSTLDAHAAYLTALESLSLARMQHILDDMPPGGILAAPSPSPSNKKSICGPGIFLSRWQQLLDETVVAPEASSGPVRTGRDVKGAPLALGKVGAGREAWDPRGLALAAERGVPRAPGVAVVVEAMGEGFRELVGRLVRNEGAWAGVV
ncbi:PX-associated-domain-containing protein [Lasiosphaeris hirsuta]|uniref:PX-associated-domain-containing protein n=1 Tax=Lasiosphaeris hirsuta TaxID=260670 RepID=A0AA40A1P0_9PEZI|nr:PX-associated-domain-containing protein [Lasiosphaeris hirsuta]